MEIKIQRLFLSGNWWDGFLLFQANPLLNFKLECYNEGNNSRLIVFNFIGGGLYGLSITNVSGDVCTDGSCSIFVLLDHPISRKTWVESQQREVTLTASEKRYRGGVPPLFSWRKTMKEMNHFGVYGVCIREGRILCIRKTRGPYRGDLICQEERQKKARVW